MISKISILLIIILFSLQTTGAAAGRLPIFSSQSGGITIHDIYLQDKKNRSDGEEPLFPLLSQVGTGLSLFTTSILYATGYSEDQIISDFGRQFNIEGSSPHSGPGIYAGEILFLLGTLTASLFNYRFGFDNDLLAIIPILPVEVSTGGVSNTHGMNDQQIRLQFGIYFYFSRDF